MIRVQRRVTQVVTIEAEDEQALERVERILKDPVIGLRKGSLGTSFSYAGSDLKVTPIESGSERFRRFEVMVQHVDRKIDVENS